MKNKQDEIVLLRHDKAVLLLENRRLRRELETDELTGLKKTRHFEKLCLAALTKHTKKRQSHSSTKHERREEERYFVVFIDLDGLKLTNDTPSSLGGGREVGNDLLRALANTLQKRTRKDDVVVRYSEASDEFGVFLTGTSLEEAEKNIKRILYHFEENADVRFPVLSEYFHSRGLKISFSYGTQEIFLDYTEDDIRKVIKRADELMHKHKERRKQDRKSMQMACSHSYEEHQFE